MEKEIKYGISPIEHAKKEIARQRVLEKVREAVKRMADAGRKIVENATISKEDLEFVDKKELDNE